MAQFMLTENELAQIISLKAGITVSPETIESGTVQFEDIDVDSLGVLSIVAELERRYRLGLGAEAESCTTPKELLDMVNKIDPNGG